MLDVLAWIIFGLFVGIIAKVIMPGKDPGGTIVTILLGIAGSLIGGFIGRALLGYGQYTDTENISRPGFFMNLVLAVIGSIILLAGYRLIKRRTLPA